MKKVLPIVRPRLRLLPPSHAIKVFFSSIRGKSAPIETGVMNASEYHHISTRIAMASSGELGYLEAGSPGGKKVIFIHGTPGSADGWLAYLAKTPVGHCFIAVDRPGYGVSQPHRGVLTLEEQAAALSKLIDYDSGERAILVGHSLGAALALQLALDYPHAISGLLLLAGAFDPELEEVNILQPLAATPFFSNLLPRAIDNANRELLGLKADLLDQASRLRKLTLPISIVHGDSDPLVPVANVDYLKEKLPGHSLDIEIIRNSDHFIPWSLKPTVDMALERVIRAT